MLTQIYFITLGSHELLYQEFLPLLSNLLQGELQCVILRKQTNSI